MNYLNFCGYWFYGAANATETASFYCSYGLLDSAPTPAVSFGVIGIIGSMFRKIIGG